MPQPIERHGHTVTDEWLIDFDDRPITWERLDEIAASRPRYTVDHALGNRTMTPKQMRMARHALGLPNGNMRSYRNRYVTAIGTSFESEWDDLVKRGMAERGSDHGASVGYCLTYEGARAALDPGEALDLEDFPEAASAAL